MKEVLTIGTHSIEVNELDNGRFLLGERRTGEFHRSLNPPEGEDVDKAESSYADGGLRVSLPKQEAKQSKHIQVMVS